MIQDAAGFPFKVGAVDLHLLEQTRTLRSRDALKVGGTGSEF